MCRAIIFGIIPLISIFASTLTDIGGDFEDYLESAAAAGVGGAGLCIGFDPVAWGYNPAVGADPGTGLMLKHTSAFKKEARIANDLLSASYRTNFGAVGITAYRNGAGDIYLTTLPDTTRPAGPDNRPIISDTVTASDWSLLFSGARQWDRLSFGANIKLIYRNLLKATGFGVGVDIGLRYRFDWGLSLALRVKNASSSPIFWSTDSTELLIPRAALGGMQEIHFGKQTFRLMLESELGTMGVDSLSTTIGPFYLLPRGGIEFVIMDVLSLRAGRGNYGWSVGAGGRYRGFFVDYAYRGHDGGLGGSHLISAGYIFNK